MTPNRSSSTSESNRTLIRRRVLAAVAGASATGLGAVAVASDSASAEITIGRLAIQDGSYEAEDPAPTPILGVDARLRYDVDSVTEYNVVLEAGPTHDDRTMLEFVNESTTATDGEFTETLSAPVTDHEAFATSDFDPEAGQTATEEIAVALVLSVMDGGETKATAEVKDTATITVSNTAVSIELKAGGEGEITFETA